MTNVSSPPQIRTPKEFQDNPDTRKFFENLSFWLFKLWKRTGGGTDLILESSDPVLTIALIAEINERLGSGQFLTSDTDSFSVDSTILFADQTEA